MGLIGTLATVFYKINEGIIYSTFLVYLLVTLIDFNEYSTDPGLAKYISTLLSFNLVLWLQSILGQILGSNGIIVGGAIAGVATISALFTRNYLLNLSQQEMSTMQIIFIYLLLQFVFNSFASITAYFDFILLPMMNNISLPFIAPPLQKFVEDLVLIVNFISMFGEVMSLIYVLMATGMWSEM
jgi:hypothetical protein